MQCGELESEEIVREFEGFSRVIVSIHKHTNTQTHTYTQTHKHTQPLQIETRQSIGLLLGLNRTRPATNMKIEWKKSQREEIEREGKQSTNFA